jgi:hypothetical protein
MRAENSTGTLYFYTNFCTFISLPPLSSLLFLRPTTIPAHLPTSLSSTSTDLVNIAQTCRYMGTSEHNIHTVLHNSSNTINTTT